MVEGYADDAGQKTNSVCALCSGNIKSQRKRRARKLIFPETLRGRMNEVFSKNGMIFG